MEFRVLFSSGIQKAHMCRRYEETEIKSRQRNHSGSLRTSFSLFLGEFSRERTAREKERESRIVVLQGTLTQIKIPFVQMTREVSMDSDGQILESH